MEGCRVVKLARHDNSSLRGTDTPEKVQKRLIRAQVELEMAGDYDYFVINDTVEQAVEELRAILCAEHCKPAERMNLIINRKEK